LYEIKRDGFRALAYIEDGMCKFVSRYEHVPDVHDLECAVAIGHCQEIDTSSHARLARSCGE